MTTDISVRYDPISQTEINEEYDGGNSSSRLFERARIKALAGIVQFCLLLFIYLLFIYDYYYIYISR